MLEFIVLGGVFINVNFIQNLYPDTKLFGAPQQQCHVTILDAPTILIDESCADFIKSIGGTINER